MASHSVMRELSKVTFERNQIRDRVQELADQIVSDLQDSDHKLVVIAIMGGAVHFFSDLTRAIGPRMHLEQDFMVVKSYEGQDSTGNVKIIFDHRADIEDCDVIIVEDIVDTGLTISAILNLLKARKPHSVRVATLFDKVERRQVEDLEIDYIGFEIDDYFIVGYGMDCDEAYRHLPFAGMMKQLCD